LRRLGIHLRATSALAPSWHHTKPQNSLHIFKPLRASPLFAKNRYKLSSYAAFVFCSRVKCLQRTRVRIGGTPPCPNMAIERSGSERGVFVERRVNSPASVAYKPGEEAQARSRRLRRRAVARRMRAAPTTRHTLRRIAPPIRTPIERMGGRESQLPRESRYAHIRPDGP
jgi:hypothetical protein